jgi:hypothetical protein
MSSIVCAAGGRCTMASHFITEVKHVCPKCDKPVHSLYGHEDGDASSFHCSTICTLCFEASTPLEAATPSEDATPSVSTLSEISVPINERNRNKRRNPPPKKRNEWLYKQFRRDYQGGTYRFFCNHCNFIAAKYQSGVFNGTKISHILSV